MAEAKEATAGEEGVSERTVADRWNQLRADVAQLFSKIAELELEHTEHSLVIGALDPMDPGRRCYRMVGGVLVERTVAEVLPAVRRNQQGLGEVLQRLRENLRTKRDQLAALEAKYNIKIRRGGDVPSSAGGREEQGPGPASQGVLVGSS